MRNYRVKVVLSTEGYIDVNAENKEEAKEFVEKHWGAMLGNIDSSLSDEEFPDWGFDTHLDKTIKSIRLR
jgi:hypothetical protein